MGMDGIIPFAKLKQLPGIGLGVTDAASGQMIRASGVDADGKPTGWEAVDGVQIVTLNDGTMTLADLAALLADINAAGEHVFFDTAALAYPLYLCTIAINYDGTTPTSYRLNDLVTGSVSMGPWSADKTLAQVLAEAVSSFYSISVTAQTQDGVIVTGQTVTVRAGGPDGPVYASAAYNGQPVSFSVPNGFIYYVSITSELPHHFNPTTASGVVSGADVSVVLTYSDFSTIRTAADIKAALDAGLDLTDLVGESITCKRDGVTLTWDVADYANDTITLLLHDTLPTQMAVEPSQALAYFEDGLAAGAYKYKWAGTYQYFTLLNDIPSGGQLKANSSTYQVYASQSDTASQESGTVSTTEIADAIDLGSTGSGMLNHHDRVSYGSNNFGESGLLQWLNSSEPANTQMPRITKLSRPYSVAQPGFMRGLDADFLAALDDTVWKCSANNVYECPAELGGIAVKGNPYTVTYKFGLASEMEVFGSYGGVADGSTVFDIFNGASADDRKKYYNGAVRYWWLRSPYWGNAYNVRYVTTSGGVTSYYAYSSCGVAPACKISKSQTSAAVAAEA